MPAVKVSLYSPGQTLRAPGAWGYQNCYAYSMFQQFIFIKVGRNHMQLWRKETAE